MKITRDIMKGFLADCIVALYRLGIGLGFRDLPA